MASSAMTTIGTAIAAARAPLDSPLFFEDDGVAVDEFSEAWVLVEEEDPVILGEEDEDPEPEVDATPASKRVTLKASVTTLPFASVLVCC